jgi:hypothetical protein
VALKQTSSSSMMTLTCKTDWSTNVTSLWSLFLTTWGGVSICFQSQVFSFYSTDFASGSHKMVSQTLHLILCIGFHWLCRLGLLHKIFTSLSTLVSDLYMLCQNFIAYFPVYPFDITWSQVFI